MFSFNAPAPSLLICTESADLATQLAAAALRAGLDPIVDPSRDPVTLASVHRPDAVLLSAARASSDARDVLAAIKNDLATEDAEVVILLDSAEPHFKVECLALGALDVRPRAVEPEFFARLRSVLLGAGSRSRTPWSVVASDVVPPSADPAKPVPARGIPRGSTRRESPIRPRGAVDSRR